MNAGVPSTNYKDITLESLLLWVSRNRSHLCKCCRPLNDALEGVAHNSDAGNAPFEEIYMDAKSTDIVKGVSLHALCFLSTKVDLAGKGLFTSESLRVSEYLKKSGNEATAFTCDLLQ